MSNAPYFQTLEKSRLSDKVARKVTQAIKEGRYLPGQVLPSQREMSLQFNVSRPVLREALRILEIQGLIHVHHGKRTFVKTPEADILNTPIRDWLAENYQLVLQFYEARLSIEPTCAALAAERGTEEDMAYLKQLMNNEAVLTREEDIPTFVSVDIDFHNTVTRISGNFFLIKMMDYLINPETDIRKIILRLPNHLSVAHNGHTAIVDAIMARDPEAARQAMIKALQVPTQAIRDYLGHQEN